MFDQSQTPIDPVGVHCLNMPCWVSNPPIEAVVFAWGASEDHQLGLDTEDNIGSPKVVESLLGIKFMGRSFVGCPLVGGSRNTLALDADGGLWSWGWNDRGTLGHGHRELQRKPACVQALAGVRIVQAAIGGWHCLALSDAGQVYCWGGNEYQQCGLVAAENVQHIPTSNSHNNAAVAAVVDRANGLSSAVNQNSSSVGNAAGYGVLPCVRDILVPLRCMPGLNVKQVACGGMNSVVLTESGEVWTWGEPWGEFALELQRSPRKVPGAVNIAAIACGAFHNMALVADGSLLTWGTNDYGQLGNGSTSYSTTPVKVVDLEEVVVSDIAAGGWHSMALTTDGQIYIWGRGEYGRLGIGDRTGSSKLRPAKVRGLEGHTVVQIAAGGTHSLALTSAGRMFIWGRASYGRLGLGPGAKDAYAPVEAELPGGHDRWRVAAAMAGGRHTMCLAVPVRDAASRMRQSSSNSLHNYSNNSRHASSAADDQPATNNIGRTASAALSADSTTPATAVAVGTGMAGAAPFPAKHGNSSPQHRQQQLCQQQQQQHQQQQRWQPQHQQQSIVRTVSGGLDLRVLHGYINRFSSQEDLASLGASAPGRGLAFSPGSPGLLSNNGQSPALQPMGVDAIYAATTAAASQLGPLRVGSPAFGTSGSGIGSVAARQQRPGSSGGLRPGQQLPLSPRGVLPPMSPSQRAAALGLGDTLALYNTPPVNPSNPGRAYNLSNTASPVRGGVEVVNKDAAEPLGDLTLQGQHLAVHSQLLQQEQAAEDDAAQQEEEQDQWALEEMDRDEEERQQQADLRIQQVAAASKAVAIDANGNHRPAADSASQGAAASASELQQQQQQPAAIRQPSASSSALAATNESNPAASSGGGSSSILLPDGHQLQQKLQAAVKGSYSRLDAARAASTSSLPSLAGGVEGGIACGANRMQAVVRSDSDLSQGASGLLSEPSGVDNLTLGGPGASPPGSVSSGQHGGGASPTGSSSGGVQGELDVTGTSPPAGLYNVSLGEAMARYTNSLPEREMIHRRTHLS